MAITPRVEEKLPNIANDVETQMDEHEKENLENTRNISEKGADVTVSINKDNNQPSSDDTLAIDADSSQPLTGVTPATDTDTSQPLFDGRTRINWYKVGLISALLILAVVIVICTALVLREHRYAGSIMNNSFLGTTGLPPDKRVTTIKPRTQCMSIYFNGVLKDCPVWRDAEYNIEVFINWTIAESGIYRFYIIVPLRINGISGTQCTLSLETDGKEIAKNIYTVCENTTSSAISLTAISTLKKGGKITVLGSPKEYVIEEESFMHIKMLPSDKGREGGGNHVATMEFAQEC